MWNLDEALSSQLAGKQTKCSEVSATHCTQRGADCVCNTLVPEMGPPFWKPFLLPVILRPRFWGRFLAPFLGPRKSNQELPHGPDSPDFVHLLAPAFLLQCKPPWTHTHPYNTMRGHGAEAVLNQWKGPTFRSRKTPCWPLALWQRAAFTTLMSGSCLACILGGAWYNVRSAPTTLTSRPTTLQGHIYDPQARLPGAHLRPSQLNLRPFKITHTTLKPACQERTYDPHSSTYDPSRPHLRPSNPHVRSAPTTLTAQPTTLQGHTYDPQTRMSGSHDDPLRTLAEYKGISQSAWKGGKAESL